MSDTASVSDKVKSSPITIKHIIIILCFTLIGSLTILAFVFVLPSPSGPASADWTEDMAFQTPNGDPLNLTVEVANVTDTNIGYAGRTTAPEEGTGMLIRNGQIRTQTITMRGIPFDLNAAWFDEQGKVTKIETLPSCNHSGIKSFLNFFCPVYSSPSSSSDVLLYSAKSK